jgi:hypothetical protein
MELTNFYDLLEIKSDKGTLHDYINGYYDSEFSPKKNDSIRIIEIGVGYGHSMYLWRHFFTNAQIIGLEANANYLSNSVHNDCTRWINGEDPSITIKLCDAYDDECINQFKDNEFDYIIDDGPHTLESQIIFIEKYISKVKTNGKLIVEDIDGGENLNKLIEKALTYDIEYKVFDLRENKNRRDDIILEIIKK